MKEQVRGFPGLDMNMAQPVPGPSALVARLRDPAPVLALAPMQDVADRSFWEVLHPYGGADLYVTEYFRVYPGSRLIRRTLRSVTENPTGRPVVAQMIGNDVAALVRTARELQQFPVAAIDLNLGCPAPVVYRQCAGGGLLRDLPRVDKILGALREAIRVPFTVKTRLGFESAEGFEELLGILARHAPDLVTVHGRTVRQMYRGAVDYDRIGQAAATLPCPVLANGDIVSASGAEAVLRQTGVRGLMIGRGAVRNPWLFAQIRDQLRGDLLRVPCGREVLRYLHALYQGTSPAGLGERGRVEKMKKYLSYIGLGIEPGGRFLHGVRRATTEAGLFGIWEEFLDHDRPMRLEPFECGGWK